MIPAVSFAAWAERCARLRTSPATTANPTPPSCPDCPVNRVTMEAAARVWPALRSMPTSPARMPPAGKNAPLEAFIGSHPSGL